ncbi:MAG: Zn-dependent oligopeptidase [Candidatus Babeliales bacterium]|nr:Zn-dependent oligopeptidase [Candidatus Babeliales bacterium]
MSLKNLFPKSVSEINELVEKTIKSIEQKVISIIDIDNNLRNFENTPLQLDLINKEYQTSNFILYSLENLSPDKDIRESSHNGILKLKNFLIDNVSQNIQLYNAFKNFFDSSENENLNKIEKYFIQETLQEFINNGLNLSIDDLEKTKKLNKEIAILGLDFETNIAKSDEKVILHSDELNGLPQDFINSLKRDGNVNYILGLDYPTYFTIMNECPIEETRRKMYLKFSTRAHPENLQVLENLIAKRHELAQLIGFESFTHLKLNSQMAKNPDRVEKFLDDIANKAFKKAEKEMTLFNSDLKESTHIHKDGKVKPWNIRYIKEAYKQKHFKLNDSEISEYFPMENTLNQLLNIYEKFLSLKFTQPKVTGLWHDDVKLIEAYDVKDNTFLGSILLDLHPRENKFSHAAMIPIVPTLIDSLGNVQPSVTVLMMNFPDGTNNQPALLKFDDVNTFFHEFGHAIHSLLNKTTLASLAGTNTKIDFVEMPSQMLEDWLQDKDIIKMISKHYITGEPLPEHNIDMLINLEKFDSGDVFLRQIYLASLSLNYYKNAPTDTHISAKELHDKIRTHIAWEPTDFSQASFGHLNEYGPSYYGYLWSKVFAKDLFKEIKKHGLLNPEIGKRYIDTILSKGGSQDPNELLKDFLLREPNQEAFLEDLGFND